MGMYHNHLDILDVIRNDEILLRLLYYPPENLATGDEDPLSPSLPDILKFDKRKLKDIRNEHIVKSSKSDDLVSDEPMCRLYVYMGRRSSSNQNYLTARQEVIFEIFVHNDIEDEDLRIARISDRLNELLVRNRITGITRVNYVDGYPINAPKGFVAFRHIYSFEVGKK